MLRLLNPDSVVSQSLAVALEITAHIPLPIPEIPFAISGNSLNRALPLSLQDMIRLKVREGMFLFENGLLHLDPTWINDLFRAILDHRLQNPPEAGFWQRELMAFADRYKLMYNELSNTHQTFCAKGMLTVSYLKFLWREVKGTEQDWVFDRLLETMREHGVMFSKPDGVLPEQPAVRMGTSDKLFVPVRLRRCTDKGQLEAFSALCNEWRRQLVFRLLQSYVPPGIMGMFMARLLGIKDVDVQLQCAWSRGVLFMMGGSEVLLYLNPPESCDGIAEIEVNVVGSTRADDVQKKVLKLQKEIEEVLDEKFPGLRFDLKGGEPLSLEGINALMDRMDTLEEHLHGRLDGIERVLAKVAESSRQSLLCLEHLQASDYPYPHLVAVREQHMPTSKTAKRGRKKRESIKAFLKPLSTRVRAFAQKDMVLQFLCPFDFKEVPCGPGGRGYSFGERRDWVKKVSPVVQVCAMLMEKKTFCTCGNTWTFFVQHTTLGCIR